MMRAIVIACASMITTAGNAADITVRVHGGTDFPVADAAVILEPLGAQPAASAARAVVDQVNKRFVPRMTVIRSGTAVSFPNSDHIRHQVYSFSPAKTFNLKLYAGSPPADVVFDKPGLVVLGCNIHDTMVGFIAVVDTPYFGVTAADGSVKLKAPEGGYRLRIWHAAMAGVFVPKTLQVGGETGELKVKLDLDHETAAPAAWYE